MTLLRRNFKLLISPSSGPHIARSRRADLAQDEGRAGSRWARIVVDPRTDGRFADIIRKSTALLVAGVGAVVLLSWLLNIQAAISPVDQATMKANTAAGLLLAGIALLRVNRAADPGSERAGFALSLIVTAIGLMTLFEYAAGIDLGIDQLLVPDATSKAGDIPGRMSVITALSFVLFGTARFVAVRATRLASIYFTTACALGFVASYLAVTGYVSNVAILYRPVPPTSIALSTALAFLLLFMGLAAARPELGLVRALRSRGAGGAYARRLLPPIILGAPFIGWLFIHERIASFFGTSATVAFYAAATATLMTALIWYASLQADRLDTERQIALEHLRAQKALLSTMVRNVPAAMAMFDRQMRYLRASDRWCADYQLDKAHVVGRSHYELFPEIPDRWKEVHRRCLAGETLRAEEDLFVRPDGNRMYLRWEVRPWGNQDGSPEGILIFSEDITERKEMEKLLLEQRAQIDKIIATAPGALRAFRLRPDGTTCVHYTTPGFAKMMPELPDLSRDAKPLFDMMHPDDARSLRANIAASAQNLTPLQVTYRLITPTRGTIWIEGNGMPEREPDGSVSWYGFVMDVTESRRAEESLRERDAMIAGVFETASQAIIGVGADGTIRLVNKMTETMFGYERSELLGGQMEKLLPETLRARHVAHRASFISQPRNRPMGVGLDLQGRRKDGTQIFLEVSLSHVETSQGILAVSMVTDITARRSAERALQNSERQLHELAARLLTAQEDERRRIARDLHDDIMQELALLSIEMGQLAAADSSTGEERRDRLLSLQSKVSRVANNIRRISHALHPTVIEDLGLSAALRSFFEEFTRTRGIPVRFESAMERSELKAESASCLYRIAQESLQNAAKHAHPTEIFVSLKRAGNSVELTVRDDGRGLPTDVGRREVGLGIVSMRERVRAVHGTLAIESAPGNGTEIRASVPVRDVHDA